MSRIPFKRAKTSPEARKGLRMVKMYGAASVPTTRMSPRVPQRMRGHATDVRDDIYDSMRKLQGAGAIRKSFVPGKGWVKATEVPKTALKRAAGPGRQGRAQWKQNSKDADFAAKQEYKEHERSVRGLLDTMRNGGKTTTVTRGGKTVEHIQPSGFTSMQLKASGLKAFATHTGGRKGHRTIVEPKRADKTTRRHETAHITPKRSGYRLHQILKDPKKAMREEARADMASRHVGDYYKKKGTFSRQSTSGYTSSARRNSSRLVIQSRVAGSGKGHLFEKGPVSEYRKTQDKIAAARGYTKTGKPAKGTYHAKHWKNQKAKKQAAVVGVGAPTLGYAGYKEYEGSNPAQARRLKKKLLERK